MGIPGFFVFWYKGSVEAKVLKECKALEKYYYSADGQNLIECIPLSNAHSRELAH